MLLHQKHLLLVGCACAQIVFARLPAGRQALAARAQGLVVCDDAPEQQKQISSSASTKQSESESESESGSESEHTNSVFFLAPAKKLRSHSDTHTER